jgi:hypothetical protein
MAAVTMHRSTLPGGKALIERHYDSQIDLARYVLQSWTADDRASRLPLWRAYRDNDPGKDEPVSHLALHVACTRLLGTIDPQCQAMVDEVSAIVAQLARATVLPPSLDVHRKRTMGRSGYALNIHKVNRGQLSTAWKKTVREHRAGHTGTITLVLCTDYSSNASHAAAQYTIGATLALAQKIEETGRRCEIWASILTHDAQDMRTRKGTSYLVSSCPARFDELDHLVIKRAEEEITAPTLAAVCSLSFVRALFFQVWRMQRASIGVMQNFGDPTNKAQVYARLLPYLSRQGIPHTSVSMGADQGDGIYNQQSALMWIRTKLHQLLEPSSAA